MSKTPTAANPQLLTSFDRLVDQWMPENTGEAEHMMGQCLGRAKILAKVCATYAWHAHENDFTFDEIYLGLNSQKNS
jgi:hypothetical protein